jgi:catechol 2,3-dioxygenase-like lactoylglutathione lyase family enzyme
VTDDNDPRMRCTQVVFSVADRERSVDWYTRGLGCVPSGGMIPENHREIGALQGLGESEARMGWVVDSQEFFKLEFFQFVRPAMRPRPDGWQACDIGYSMVSFHVTDLDATLSRLAAFGSLPLTEPLGPPGDRRVCVRDPDHTLIELMEADPRCQGPGSRRRPRVPVAARSVTASVPSLERARRFFVDVLGMTATAGSLHSPEHEALWGLSGAARDVLVVWSGDFAIELVRYDRPLGRPRPEGYRISDQGILNVALGSRSPARYRAMLASVAQAGYPTNTPLSFPFAEVNYVMDDEGFSAELFFLEASGDEAMGFVPAARDASTP